MTRVRPDRFPRQQSMATGRKSTTMTDEQKKLIADVMATEHVAVISTMGDDSPTTTVEAFAETPGFDIVMIMGADSDRVKNIAKRPTVSFLVINRYGDVAAFK